MQHIPLTDYYQLELEHDQEGEEEHREYNTDTDD